MDVYLIPAGGDRHQLYCELPPVDPEADPSPRTLWARAVGVFRRALAEGEQARRGDATQAPRGRLRTAITRRLAEAVAEQRLLWQLRRQSEAQLLYPDDLAADAAMVEGRRLLRLDRDKHRRWCVIDAVLTVLSAPAALLPGPNVLAYYFIFRVVGHYLSWKGADQGLARVAWTPTASPALTRLRALWTLDDGARAARLREVAAALGLDRLTSFFDDIAAGPV